MACLGVTKFSEPIEEMSKEELNECFSEEVLHVCEEETWHTVSLQKFINEIHLRSAISRFLRSLPLNKPFSVISDPAFTEANKALEHLLKTSEKRATLPAY